MKQVAKPAKILDVHRVRQAEQLAQRLLHFRLHRAFLPNPHRHGIARHKANEREDQDRQGHRARQRRQ